jgi:hypothetical protein
MNLKWKEIFNPEYGFFKPSANGVTMQPNPDSTAIYNYRVFFRYFGRLVAKAIIQGLPL